MKRTKKLLALLIVLVLAFGIYFVVSMISREKAEKTATKEVKADSSVQIFDFGASDILSFSWSYQGESYLVARTDNSWSLSSIPDFCLDADMLEKTAETFASYTASRVLESGLDDSLFGLDQPSCAVTAILNDGRTVRAVQGLTETTSGLHYLSVDGKLYAVSTDLGTMFGKGLAGLYKNDPIPDMTNITALEFTANNQSYRIVYDPDSEPDYGKTRTYFLEENGKYTALNAELTQTLFSTVAGFKWAKIQAYGVSEDDLDSVYALSEPEMEFTVEYTDSEGTACSFTAQIGAQRTSYYRVARLPGSDAVYDIVNTVPDVLLAFTLNDYKDLAVLGFESINNITVGFEGGEYMLYFAADNGSVVFHLGDHEITEDDYLTITPMLTLMTAQAIAAPEDAGEELISFSLATKNEILPEITLSFCECDIDSYLCIRSDGEAFRVNAAAVDRLIRAIRMLLH